MTQKEKIDKEFLKFSKLYNADTFIFQVFSYLRLHRELWEDKEYSRLYEECLDYLKIDLLEKFRKDGTEIKKDKREFVMLLADIAVKCREDEFAMTEDLVSAYLEFRKGVWTGALL